MTLTTAVALVVLIAIAASAIYLVYDAQQETVRQNNKMAHERQLLSEGYEMVIVRLYTSRSQLDDYDDAFAFTSSEDMVVWRKPGQQIELVKLEGPETLIKRID